MQRIEYWAACYAQPDTLRTTLAAARVSLAAGPVPVWDPGTSLAAIGMGASTYAAETLVAEARIRGRVVLNWPASDWTSTTPAASVAVAISESGRSPETIEALRLHSGARIVLTNVPSSPVTELADIVVDWGGVPDAGVYVTGFTSSLVALTLTAEALGMARVAEGLDRVPALVAEWLPRTLAGVDDYLAAAFPTGLPDAVEYVGSGPSFSSACEGALLMREAGRTPSAAYPVDQYLHGPAEALRAGLGLVVLGDRRTEALVRLAEGAGVAVLQVAERPTAAHRLRLPPVPGVAGVILQAVAAQVLAGRIGDRRGHELGTFRYEFEGTKLVES